MTEKVFEKISEIEAKAAQIIKKAKKEATHKITYEKEKGEHLLKDLTSKAKDEAEKLYTNTIRSAQNEAKLILKKSQDEIRSLKDKVAPKITQAKKIIE